MIVECAACNGDGGGGRCHDCDGWGVVDVEVTAEPTRPDAREQADRRRVNRRVAPRREDDRGRIERMVDAAVQAEREPSSILERSQRDSRRR